MKLAELIAATGLPPEVLLLLLLPFGGFVLVLIAVFGIDPKRDRFKRRMARVRGERVMPKLAPKKQINVRISTSDSKIPAIDRFIKQMVPRRDQLRHRLDGAGLSISLATYLVICLVTTLVVFGGAVATGIVPLAGSVLIGLTAGLGLPHVLVSILTNRRRAKFIANFPEAIDLMTRGLKSGLPITESIRTAGDEVPNPVGKELRWVTDSVRLGGKLDEVLWEASERIGLQEFKFFTIALAIQSETGGNLTETLQNLSEVLRRRRQLKLKIKALSSEAKASAYIIGALPFIMAVVIYMVNPGYITTLVEDPRGHVMIGMGLTSFFIGAVVMWKMVRFDH